MNLKSWFISVLLALINVCWVNAQEFIAGVGVNYNWGEKWSFGGELQNRNNRASEVHTQSWIFQADAGYEIIKRLKVSATYRKASTQTTNYFSESDIENVDKNRYTTNIAYTSKRFKNEFRVSQRLRYQYSEYEERSSKEYLRYKLSVDYKLSKNAKPYLAIEPYYYLNKNRFKYARMYLGNEFNFHNTKFDIFLITETKLGEEVLSLHYMLGLKVNFCFKSSNN